MTKEELARRKGIKIKETGKSPSDLLVTNIDQFDDARAPRTENAPDAYLCTLDIASIDENPDNEKIFSMNNIDRLAKLIEEQGFESTILVYRKDDGRFEIIAGHRRYRGAVEAGLKEIYALVRPKPSETEKATILLSSNLENRVLKPIEMMNAVMYYYDNVLTDEWKREQTEKGLCADKRVAAAEFFNCSERMIQRYKAMATLVPELQSIVNNDGFPFTALDGVNMLDADLQKTLAAQLQNILDHEDASLSAKDVVMLVSKLKPNDTKSANNVKTTIKRFNNSTKKIIKFYDELSELHIDEIAEVIDLTSLDDAIEKLQSIRRKIE